MSVCNIFKSPENSSSVFYTFSEYGNSLAGVIAGDGLQESTPSKFIAMKLPDDKFPTIYKQLQCWYDDLCCRMRDNGMDIQTRGPQELSALISLLTDNGAEAPFYSGGIDVISKETIDGLDYCDCVCWMGPDAKRNTGIEKGDEFVVRKDPADTFISGYETEESRASGVSAAGYNTLLQEKNNIYNYTLTPQQPIDEESFEFNCIVVLFNITIGDTTVSDIPMGIYLTKNPVVKNCSSDVIYGQGTSWSLKIGMRWANTVDGSSYAEVVADPKGEYGSFLACIDRMNTTIDYMNEMTLAFNKMYNNVTDIIYSHLGADPKGSTYWNQFRNAK